MGGVHQGVLTFQQGRDFAGAGLSEDGRALVGQAEVAATRPGVLNDGLVGQGTGSFSHDEGLVVGLVFIGARSSPRCTQCRLWLFKVNASTVQLFMVDCAKLFICENAANRYF
jgi:hypothetical protein